MAVEERPSVKGLSRGRAFRRICVAVILLGAAHLAVSSASGHLDETYLTNFRLPMSATVPLGELAGAVSRTRGLAPHRRTLAMAGSSIMWGYHLKEHETLPVALENLLTPANVRTLNLARVHNSFADDRAIASFFKDRVDGAIIPYSIHSMLQASACLAHPDIVEWNLEPEDPFPQHAGCTSPPRHRINAKLEGLVSGLFAPLRHRGALRNLIFRDPDELGPWLREGFEARAQAHQSVRQSRPAALPAPPRLSASDWSSLELETERLCRVYAEAGVPTWFVELPTLLAPSDRAAGQALIQGMESLLARIAARIPRCQRLPLVFESPVTLDEMLDHVHLSGAGAAKVARSLADALRGPLARTGTGSVKRVVP